MFDAIGVMESLKAAGIKVIDYTEGNDNEQVDGKVQLNDSVHVQVGPTYLCLVKETPDKRFMWMHETTSLTNMIYFIKLSIKERRL